MNIFLILICFIFPVKTKKNELHDEFLQYGDCLERSASKVGGEKRIQVIHAIRGSDVIMPCFTCVSPEDGVEIDSTYKPSAGTVGRAFNSLTDFFKEKLLRSRFSMPDKNKWKYDWEVAMLGRKFTPLSSMHFSASSTISDRIRRFVKKDEAKFKLGDRYELVLKNVDKNSTGFYRCINRHGRSVIANMYFLEVSNSKKIIPIVGKVGEDSIPENITRMSEVINGTKIEMKATEWSKCSYCSSDRGEQTRTIKCFLESTSQTSHLSAFDQIDCSSSLVPIEMRRKLKKRGDFSIYLEYRQCYEECTSEEYINKIVNSPKGLGDFRALDYLPGGEYIFGDLLPRLFPEVTRRVQLVIANDPLVLTCHKLIDLNAGVHWFSLRYGAIQHSNIQELYKKRAFFDENTNLVFNKFTMEDDDEYFCYSSNNILLGTFHIRVVGGETSERIVGVFKIIVKFSAFILIFALIANQIFR